MTEQEKLNLVTNYFAEDWAIKKAMQLLEEYENAQQLASSADSVLLDWLEQHDGRYYNLDKVASVVGTGFLVQSKGNMPQVYSKLREAIDATRKQGTSHD